MLTTQSLRYQDGASALNGFLAWDATRADRRPGILVVHGGAGLDDHARDRARRFAEWGYVAFACDMYGEGVTGDRERVLQCIAEFQAEPIKLCCRARPAMDILRAHPQVDGRLAAVGYCFGGMAVLEFSRSGMELAAVVSVHGGLATHRPAEPAAIKARLLICHGALDPHVPMSQVAAFTEEMNRACADYQLIVYGGAMHGFTHDTATGQRAGVAYHAPSDARSTSAIRMFFEEVFGSVS